MEVLQESAYEEGVMTYEKRMVEMYHSRTEAETSDRILTEFKKNTSRIRVIIATVAFGLGVDISDIGLTVIWGVPDSILTLWQMIGRCGRNGNHSATVVVPFARSRALCTDTKIKDLLECSDCYRQSILKNFILEDMKVPAGSSKENCECALCKCSMCRCCNICAMKCSCSIHLHSLF